MLVPVLLFIVGLVCLVKGGDWFVDGATAIARKFHLPELLIGATVVSIGTTLPEVMVSATSAVSGHGEIAYGNAIGSIICNTALIAAITVAVRPGAVNKKALRIPVAFFFTAAVIYAVVAYGFGYFSRPVGFIMLAIFVIYMIVTVRQMKKSPDEVEVEEVEEQEEMSVGKMILLLVAGAAIIAVGANLLVDNGTLIAQALGVSGVCDRADLRSIGNFPSGAGNSHHLPDQGPWFPVSGQCYRCQYFQSGTGKRRVSYPVPLCGSPECNPFRTKCIPGA